MSNKSLISGLAEVQQSIYQYLAGVDLDIKTPVSGVNLPALPHLLIFNESKVKEQVYTLCFAHRERALRTANASRDKGAASHH